MDFIENQLSDAFCNIILSALPEEIRSDLAGIVVNIDSKRADFVKLIETFLRAHPCLDWQAYLLANPDIQAASIDPVNHFLNYGAHEGRKLAVKKSWRDEYEVKTSPKVSIVCVNYNNGVFLEKSLGSLMSQTLKDIEIIFVDDGSEDKSLAIAKKLAEKDERIRIISFPDNRSTHMARKAGVASTTGEYVMFLDSDDYYISTACERAYEAISQGYDIVAFNVKVVNCSNLSRAEIRDRAEWYGCLEPGVYAGEEKLNLAYTSGLLPHFLWSKIFAGKLVRESFANSVDGHFRLLEDQYEFLLIISRARNLLKINETLVCYVVGKGITSMRRPHIPDAELFQYSSILKAFEIYCDKHMLPEEKEHERRFTLRCSFELIPQLLAGQVTRYFNGLRDRFGLMFMMSNLVDAYFKQPILLASCFSHYRSDASLMKLQGKLGIFCWGAPNINELKLIEHIGKEAKARNIDCIIFMEKPAQVEAVASGGMVYYIEEYSPRKNQGHISSLQAAVAQSRVECMLFLDSSCPMLLFDIILLQLMGVVVGGIYREEFVYEFYNREKTDNRIQHEIFKCLDFLACLDSASALYFRIFGINSYSICETMPFRKIRCKYGVESVILVMGSGDPLLDQTLECLPYLGALALAEPNVRFSVVDNFHDGKKSAKIRETVDRLGLASNIRVMHYENDLDLLMGQSIAMLSTSRLGAYNIVGREFADLPIFEIAMPAKNNKPVLWDLALTTEMSREILELLRCGNNEGTLNTMCYKTAHGFAKIKFGLFFEVMRGQGNLPQLPSGPGDYATAIRNAALHA